jgi:outer membrane autotransporter protein
MLRKWWISIIMMGCMVLYSSPAISDVGARPLVDSKIGDVELSLVLNKSEIEYEYDGTNDEFEVDRTTLGVNLLKRIGSRMNIYGTFGYLFDGSYNDDGLDFDLDQGYFLSAGAKYNLFCSGPLSGHVYSQFDYILEETYGLNNRFGDHEVELDGFEITLGGAFKYQVNENFSAYGGLSFLPVVERSFDYKVNGTQRQDGDIDYKDKLGLKIGGQYNIDKKWTIGAEASFLNETAYGLSIGTTF